MVLAAYRIRVSERELRQRTGWQEQFGTSSTVIVETAIALGFVNSRETSGLRLYDLRDALRAGFDFLGHWFSAAGVGVAQQTVARMLDKVSRLYKQNVAPSRIGTYVQRWARAGLGALRIDLCRVSPY
jgi:hypothetical protein